MMRLPLRSPTMARESPTLATVTWLPLKKATIAVVPLMLSSNFCAHHTAHRTW